MIGSQVRAALAVARRHWLFGLLLVAGMGLRVVASIAYHPALIRSDSVGYLSHSHALEPAELHPIGYQLFLRLFPIDQSLAAVSVLQHVLILAVSVLLYVLLQRLGVPRWLGALATAPVLLDAYQLDIEQYVLSETLFEVLLVAGCVALLWRRPPGPFGAGLAGLLLAAAALTRSVALVVVVPAVLAVLFLSVSLPVGARLVRAGALATVFLVVIAGYAIWFHSHHGVYGVTTFGGRILYGRVAEMIDCDRLTVSARERPLCVRGDSRERPTANQLMWYREHSPLRRLDPPAGKDENEVAGDFAKRVIRDRPFTYLAMVGSEFLQSFHPVKTSHFDDVSAEPWRFPVEYRVPRPGHRWADVVPRGFPEDYTAVQADSSLAAFLQGYQRFAYTPGTLLGACLLAGLAAALGAGRALRSGLRAPAFVFASIGLSLLLASVATTIFNWRYHLPELVLFPPAAAVGVTALLGLGTTKMEPAEGEQAEPASAREPLPESPA